MLLALIIGYVVTSLLVIIPVALLSNINAASGDTRDMLNTLINMGTLLFIVQAIFVMIYDWRGVVTLRGWTRSRAWQESQLGNFTLLFVLLYLCFPPIMLLIYLFRIGSGRREAEEQKRLAMKRHMAVMEVQLGILPPTSGACRACHKALQTGAEFCQYCGVPVVERPKVCPACAATALPDAKWCPQCGVSLR
jgi:RNA polymerase subunit RPABC4/transcription elongation factor Spt4